MAYLNLRDRRIEAKVAYVGPAASGKATNLEQLRRSLGAQAQITNAGDALSLSWQPADNKRFRDCEVSVRVVAQRGAYTDERLVDMLRDVDAVVLVADAEPAAGERNRECLAALRRAIEAGQRRVSLIVQVNKSDVPDALGVAAVLDQLEARDVPHVRASALSGQGVVETLESAVSDILAAMNEESAIEPPPDTVRPGGRAPGAPATDGGHPLLSALRQILRDTAREQGDAMAARVNDRFEDAISRVALQVMRVDAALEASAASRSASQRAIDDRLREIAASLEDVTTSTAERASKEDLSVVAASVSRVREDLTARLTEALEKAGAAEEARTAAIVARLAALEAAREAERAHLSAVAEQLASVVNAAAHGGQEHLAATHAVLERAVERAAERSHADHERALSLVQGVEAAVRDAARANSAALSAATPALVGALDDRARAHREQLAAVAHTLGKAVAQVSVDVSVDHRAGLGDVLARVDTVVKGLAGVAAQLTAGSGELQALSPRIDGALAAAAERAEATAAALREISASLSAGFAATELSHRATQSRVTELVEELNKPKRGWFT